MLSRDIEIFRAVMTAGSATKAARLLAISQPAVSLALRRLEEHAEIELFQRARGKLVPTQEAVALLVEVQRHFLGMGLIEHRIRTLKQFGAGRVRIASFPGLGVGFLPAVRPGRSPSWPSPWDSAHGFQDVLFAAVRDNAPAAPIKPFDGGAGDRGDQVLTGLDTDVLRPLALQNKYEFPPHFLTQLSLRFR